MKKNNAFQKFLKSMRFRLILLCLIVGILPCLVLRAGFLKAYEDQAASTRSIAIISQAKILADQIAANDYINKQNTESITVQLNQLSNIYDGRVMLIDSAFQIVADTYGLDETKTIISEEVVQSLSGKEISKYDKESRYLEMTLPIKAANSTEVIGVMLVSVSMDSVLHDRDAVGRNAAILTLIIGVLILAFAIFASGRLVRPLRRMEKSIRDIQTGYEEDGLNVNTYTETKEMSESFNQLFGRMKTIDDSRQEFVSNVSHELKTPMTTIAGYTDGILDGTIPPEQEKEYLRIISDEARRLSRLVRRMLEVSQLQSRDLTRTKAPFDVCESMRRVLISMEKKITDRGLDVDADIPDSGIMVLGHNDLITQVIYNLLENAAKFARKGSALYLGVTTLNGKALISVRNEGDTIPAEEIPLLFERFHKSDKSRSEDKDGVGLGLYVVKTILDQHKEHIAVTSENGLTTFTFSVTLAGGQTAQ